MSGVMAERCNGWHTVVGCIRWRDACEKMSPLGSSCCGWDAVCVELYGKVGHLCALVDTWCRVFPLGVYITSNLDGGGVGVAPERRFRFLDWVLTGS